MMRRFSEADQTGCGEEYALSVPCPGLPGAWDTLPGSPRRETHA